MIKSYELYTQSNLDWIGNIPKNWKLVKLKHFAKVSFSSVDRHEKEDEIRVNICHYPDAYKNDKIDYETQLSIGTCSQMQFDNFQLKEGQVVITKDSESANDIGIPTYINETFEDAVCGYHLAQITVNEKKLVGKFLFRYLQTRNVSYFFETNANGVTRFGLGKKTIQNLVLPLPSNFEQTKIAEYLDHQTGLIDAIIEKKQRLIEKLKEQRQAIINQTVTKGLNQDALMKESGVEWLGEIPEHWKVVKLKFLTEKIIDGAHFTPTYVDSGIPFLRVTDIQTQTIDLSKVKFIPEEEHKNLIKRCKPEKGDVLLSKNGTIGITKVIDWDWEFSIFVSLCLIKFKDELSPYYFSHFFNSTVVDQQIKVGSKTTSVTNLHLDKIKELIIAIPSSIKEQNNICNYLDLKLGEIDSIIFKVEKSIEQQKLYRQSIISEAVTGKVDVREWEPIKETV